jgi:hypothetical protein
VNGPLGLLCCPFVGPFFGGSSSEILVAFKSVERVSQSRFRQ